mgnify:CR=1 FL=1
MNLLCITHACLYPSPFKKSNAAGMVSDLNATDKAPMHGILQGSQYIGHRWASTTLSLHLCSEFIGSVVGQASFLFHISKQTACFRGYES